MRWSMLAAMISRMLSWGGLQPPGTTFSSAGASSKNAEMDQVVVWVSSMWIASLPPVQDDVCVEAQGNVQQRSLTHVWKCKRTCSSVRVEVQGNVQQRRPTRTKQFVDLLTAALCRRRRRYLIRVGTCHYIWGLVMVDWYFMCIVGRHEGLWQSFH